MCVCVCVCVCVSEKERERVCGGMPGILEFNTQLHVEGVCVRESVWVRVCVFV